MEHSTLLFTLAIVFGLFMAWGVGANDVANAMGTSVGSGALSFKQAIIIAAIFEATGAILAGGQVTDTIRNKIIDVQLFIHTPTLLVYGMLASLLAAGTWLLIATRFGLPVSTTHSIIGAILGFGLIVLGNAAIYWHKVINIVLSWVISPVLSGIVAFLLSRSAKWLIFDSTEPIRSAQRLVPCYIFLVAYVIFMVTLTKGLKNLGFMISYGDSLLYAGLFSFIVTLFGAFLIRRLVVKDLEKIFAILMIFTASAMAFAHGSNDVANAIGPLSAVVTLIQNGGNIVAASHVPFWILALGAFGIVLGLSTFGYRVIRTVGTAITLLTPSRGFAAELATATTVVIASGLGLPVSTTQVLVGGVLGVGIAQGKGALNFSIIRNIFISWVVTLPMGAIFAILYFYLFKITFK